jgi:outer membrane immunogenic protein
MFHNAECGFRVTASQNAFNLLLIICESGLQHRKPKRSNGETQMTKIRLFLLSVLATAALAPGSGVMAADILAEPEPVFDWTGFYIGAGAGWASADFDVEIETDPAPDFGEISEADLHDDGFLGTVQAGFDWQISEAFVIGIMGDYTFVDLDDELANEVCYSGGCVAGDPFEGQIVGAGVDDMITVSGRLGILFDPSWLAYGLVGWTWADVENSYFEGCTDTPCDNIDFKVDDTADGLTVGGGLEGLITENLSLRLEYRFTNLDEVEHDAESDEACCTAATEVETDVHSIRATLNWRFGNLF